MYRWCVCTQGEVCSAGVCVMCVSSTSCVVCGVGCWSAWVGWCPLLASTVPSSASLLTPLPSHPVLLYVCPLNTRLSQVLRAPFCPFRDFLQFFLFNVHSRGSNPKISIAAPTHFSCHILDALGHSPPLAVPLVCMTASPKPDSLCGLSTFRKVTATVQRPGSHLPIPSVPAGWNSTLVQSLLSSAWIGPLSCLLPYSLQEVEGF